MQVIKNNKLMEYVFGNKCLNTIEHLHSLFCKTDVC